MATMNVKDAAGSTVAVEKPNANGRAAAAASRPVALSTEDLAALNAILTKLGDVGLSAASLAALESITVGGTVEIGATSLAALETIDLGATSLAALEAVTVGGTVELGSTSLAALESITATGPLTDAQLRATAVPVNIDASLKSGTATRASVNSGTSSVTILASNANRKGATILNSDANALLLDLSGGAAASTRYQVRLAQYQSYEVGSGYTGAITGIWEADGAGIADVVEFT